MTLQPGQRFMRNGKVFVVAALKPGQRFIRNGKVFVVAHVNESRAHCVSETKIEVVLKDRTFQAASGDTLDISPNSLVDVVELA